MAIKSIEIEIVGISPLLMHSTRGMKVKLPPGEGKLRGKGKDIPSPAEEAELGAYRLPNGDLCLKSEAFSGSLRGGVAGLTVKPGDVGRGVAAKNVFAAGVAMSDELVPLYHPKSRKPLRDYIIDTRRAVIHGNGIMRSRPRLEVWACKLRMDYDDDLLAPQTILEGFVRAGRIVGVGDQRPGAPKTPGPFGRYKVALA